MPNEEEQLTLGAETEFLKTGQTEQLGEVVFDDEFEIIEKGFSNNDIENHLRDDLVHVLSPCWFKVSGNISVATNVDLSWIAPVPLNIVEVYGYIRTAPVGAAALIDINKNGTSIFATRLTIADGANTGSQKALRITGQPHLNVNDRLDIDVDQIGSGTAGANLSVFVRFKLV